jgi:hypothetical protein
MVNKSLTARRSGVRCRQKNRKKKMQSRFELVQEILESGKDNDQQQIGGHSLTKPINGRTVRSIALHGRCRPAPQPEN